MPLRLLLVSNYFPPNSVGGAEIVAFRQARELVARGHAVTVLAGEVPGEDRPSGTLRFAPHEGIPVYRLALRSLEPDDNFRWPLAARHAAALIASHGIDVLHMHNAMGLGVDMLRVAQRASIRSVVTLHDHWGFCFRATRLRADGAICADHEACAGCRGMVQPRGLPALPMRLRRDYVAHMLRRADRLISPSHYLAEAYVEAGFPRERIDVLSNGIDLDALPPAHTGRQGAVAFTCSAYLGEHKGIPVLLDALRILAADDSLAGRWRVTILGEGTLRPLVDGAIAEMAGRADISAPGQLPRSQALATMAEADVCLLPSVWPENEPVSMLEAIALGKAQIATAVGGNPGLVEHDRSGLLVPPGDPRPLAEAMRRYILDPALAAAHGARNLSRRAAFAERTTIDRLEAILAAPPAPAAPREPVIICGAGWPSEQAAAAIARLHEHLPPGLVPRLVWHGWAGDGPWDDAAALWFWDRLPEEPLIAEALRRGLPVLAPDNGWARALARQGAPVLIYETYLEALAALRALLLDPGLTRGIARRARLAAAGAAALAPNHTFRLLAEDAR